jgi:hypothetical protein
MTDLIHSILLYPCWAVVILRIRALRSKNQRPLWFALLMLGLGMTMLQRSLRVEIERITGVPRIEDVLSSLMAIGVATTILTFAIRAFQRDVSAPTPFRNARAISCGVTVATMVTTFLIVTFQRIPTRDRFLPIPGAVTVHTLYWATYLTYMITVTAATTVLLVRVLSEEDSWLVRTPIAFLTVAVSTFIIFLITRIIVLFTYSSSSILFGTYISSIHTVGVAAGCSIAAFVPLLQGLSARRDINRLYPLWKELCTELPHIALYPPRPRWIDALIPQNSQLRLYRRLIEIRDGLLIMRDWAVPTDLHQIRTGITDTAVPSDHAEALVMACWLKVALAARRAGLPRTDEPLDLVRIGGDDWESELNWLRKLAAAWSISTVAQWASALEQRRAQGEAA